jgi:aspartyl protease family protein
MMPDDPNDQARLLYLSILGLLVASGMVYHYRNRLGAALQHAAIWGLIFAGMTLVYGFKDQLLTQLNPDRAQTGTSGALELRRATDGHFYARVEVNGADIRFVVDTGASALVLSRQDAERAGIAVDQLEFVIPTMTANGRVYGAPVRLDQVAFGGYVDRDFRAMVNGGDSGESLLGMDYLGRFRSLRIEGDTLYLDR